MSDDGKLEACPCCGARPFEPFLRFQVMRTGWGALKEHWRAWRQGRNARVWCLICWSCKEIVGYE